MTTQYNPLALLFMINRGYFLKPIIAYFYRVMEGVELFFDTHQQGMLNYGICSRWLYGVAINDLALSH